MSGKSIACDTVKMKLREMGAHTWRSMDIIPRYDIFFKSIGVSKGVQSSDFPVARHQQVALMK